jgi:hypothetical protein
MVSWQNDPRITRSGNGLVPTVRVISWTVLIGAGKSTKQKDLNCPVPKLAEDTTHPIYFFTALYSCSASFGSILFKIANSLVNPSLSLRLA